MDEKALDALLAERLHERNARQTSCFQELALLFGTQLDKVDRLERAASQSSARQKLEHGFAAVSAEGPQNTAQGDNKRSAAKQDVPPLAAPGFLGSAFELQREVLRLRNEASSVREALGEAREVIRREKAGRRRAEQAEASLKESVAILSNELKALRTQHKSTEEQLLESAARIHDLEARMIEEKIKMAETLNSMNDMFRISDSSKAAQMPAPGPPRPSTPAASPTMQRGPSGVVVDDEQAGEGHAATLWVSNVGASLPTEWKVLSDARGVSATSVCYSRGGTLLACGGSDGVVQLWSPQLRCKTPGGSVSIRQPVLSLDLKGSLLLATGDRVCYLWRITGDTGGAGDAGLRSVHRLTGHSSSVVTGKLTPDCRYAATGGRKVKVWDVVSGDPLRTIDAFSKCLSLDVNEQGSLLVTGHADKSIRLWDLRTAKRAAVQQGLHKAPITCVSFSPDGQRVLTCSMDHSLAILDVAKMGETAPPERVLFHQEFRVNPWWCKSTFSPGLDSTGSLLVACGSKTGSLHIWSAGSGEHLYSQKAHADAVSCTAWSPTAGQLATCDAQGGIMLWTAPKRSAS